MTSKIYIFILFLIFNFCYTQQIKIKELEALTIVDIDSFTDFLIKKKYKLDFTSDNRIGFKYISPDVNLYYIQRTQKDENAYVMYMISDTNEYQKIKQELSLNNYTFKKSENSDKVITLYYQRLDNKFIASIDIKKDIYKIFIFPL